MTEKKINLIKEILKNRSLYKFDNDYIIYLCNLSDDELKQYCEEKQLKQ